MLPMAMTHLCLSPKTLSHTHTNTHKDRTLSNSLRPPSSKVHSSFSPDLPLPRSYNIFFIIYSGKGTCSNTKMRNTNRQRESGERCSLRFFPPCSSRFAVPSLTAPSLPVVGWSLCLLLADFHAYMPFVWRRLCWSRTHNLLRAAVLLSLWSVSACIITEQWTM